MYLEPKTYETSDEEEQREVSDHAKGTLYRKPSAGGLVTAVAPVMVQSGGNMW